MPEHHRGDPTGTLDGDPIDLVEPTAPADAGHDVEEDAGVLPANDEFARDIAEIERATAVLRRAEPALETWHETSSATRADDAAASAVRKTRPVWLLISAVWLSTALVTVGAVAAIARLIG